MMRSAGGDDLPVVDEVLAAALTAQGEAGLRALDLLQDARRFLTGGLLRRSAEVAESCLRGAADALLSLPGAPEAVGLKDAATALLDTIDARPDPGSSGAQAALPDDGAVTCPDRPVPAGESGGVGRAPAAGPPQPVAVPRPSAGPPAATSAGGAGMNGDDGEEQLRLRQAADVLRGQLKRPGGYHRARAARIAERLMSVRLGAAQQEALSVWGEVYGKTSGTLHGRRRRRRPGPRRRPLPQAPGRRPGVAGAAARPCRAGPRAGRPEGAGRGAGAGTARLGGPAPTVFFFRSGPAATWLPLLHEHAPHLLAADDTAGVWPAGPFLEHLATASPEAVRPWLADHAVVTGRCLCRCRTGTKPTDRRSQRTAGTDRGSRAGCREAGCGAPPKAPRGGPTRAARVARVGRAACARCTRTCA